MRVDGRVRLYLMPLRMSTARQGKPERENWMIMVRLVTWLVHTGLILLQTGSRSMIVVRVITQLAQIAHTGTFAYPPFPSPLKHFVTRSQHVLISTHSMNFSQHNSFMDIHTHQSWYIVVALELRGPLYPRQEWNSPKPLFWWLASNLSWVYISVRN